MLTPARLTSLATAKPFARRLIGMARHVRGGYVSIAIVAAMLVAAGYTLPWRPGPGTVPPIWRVPKDASPLAVGTELPVFCLPAAGVAVRCGIGRMRDGGQVGFVPYGPLPNPHDTLPVLATADIGLLWALADPAARAQVQASAAALATQMVASVRSVTDSDAWRGDYRESLRGLLDRASQAAWRADDTQRAFRALLRASEPVMEDSLAHQIGPALAPYISDAFWSVIKTNSGQVLSLIAGQPLDLSPIGAALSQALQDPRTQAALGHTAPKIMDLPQTELLFERMASNMADALQRDPETSALLTRIAMDPRLGDELGHVRNHLAIFVHQLGEVLWGLGSGSSMNSLAGLSVKTEIVGQSQPLILLIDSDDAATLVRGLPGRATLLVPETLQ